MKIALPLIHERLKIARKLLDEECGAPARGGEWLWICKGLREETYPPFSNELAAKAVYAILWNIAFNLNHDALKPFQKRERALIATLESAAGADCAWIHPARIAIEGAPAEYDLLPAAIGLHELLSEDELLVAQFKLGHTERAMAGIFQKYHDLFAVTSQHY